MIHLTPLLIGDLNIHRGKPKYKPIHVLLDSGTSSSIVMGHFMKKLRVTKTAKVTCWNTKAGIFKTNKTCKVQFALPEFDTQKIIEWTMHVDDSATSNLYDMIIGTDLMTELGITINFAEQIMMWDSSTAPLKDCGCTLDIDILNLIYEEAYYSEILFAMSE